MAASRGFSTAAIEVPVFLKNFDAVARAHPVPLRKIMISLRLYALPRLFNHLNAFRANAFHAGEFSGEFSIYIQRVRRKVFTMRLANPATFIIPEPYFSMPFSVMG